MKAATEKTLNDYMLRKVIVVETEGFLLMLLEIHYAMI